MPTKETRNCKHCNSVMQMRKVTNSLKLGKCPKCKHTWALVIRR